MGKYKIRKEIKRQKKEIQRAVFLDRDGVINYPIMREGKPYSPNSLNEFKIFPDVMESCIRLKQSGYKLIVATNQPDVGRGILSQSIVETIHSFMSKQLPIDRIEVCYHPGRELSICDCRKPRPGMLLHSASELDLDLTQSWMIGDRFVDVECGHAAGCQTILVGDGYKEKLLTTPDFRVQNLREAVTIILEQDIF